MAVKLLTTLLMVAAVVVLICNRAESRPSYDANDTEQSNNLQNGSTKHRHEYNACEQQQGEVRAVCQRCAKETKSNVVYPACCDNRTEVLAWCKLYLNFGVGK